MYIQASSSGVPTTSLWADTSTVGSAVVPVGGTTGQVLAKNSNADYDTGWTNTAPDPLGFGFCYTTDPRFYNGNSNLSANQRWYIRSVGSATITKIGLYIGTAVTPVTLTTSGSQTINTVVGSSTLTMSGSTASFAASGNFIAADNTGTLWQLAYTGISGSTFTGVSVVAVNNTFASVTFSSGTTVTQGCVAVAIHANSGTGRNAVPGTLTAWNAVGCPSTGYQEISLGGSYKLNNGDWISVASDSATITFGRSLSGGFNMAGLNTAGQGLTGFQSNCFNARNTPSPTFSYVSSYIWLGIP
jgi:hypothetical protein